MSSRYQSHQVATKNTILHLFGPFGGRIELRTAWAVAVPIRGRRRSIERCLAIGGQPPDLVIEVIRRGILGMNAAQIPVEQHVIRRGDHIEGLRQLAVPVNDDRNGQREFFADFKYGLAVIVDSEIDRDDRHIIAVLVINGFQVRHFLPAGSAPARPELQVHGLFAAKVLDPERAPFHGGPLSIEYGRRRRSEIVCSECEYYRQQNNQETITRTLIK